MWWLSVRSLICDVAFVAELARLLKPSSGSRDWLVPPVKWLLSTQGINLTKKGLVHGMEAQNWKGSSDIRYEDII
jgi:hypothetical protein